MGGELTVADLRRELPWGRWGKLAFVVVVAQGLLLHWAVGPGLSAGISFLLLWLTAAVYVSLATSNRLQAQLSAQQLILLVNLLAALLPWLGGGYLGTAMLPAVGINALLLPFTLSVPLALLQTASSLVATYVTLPVETSVPINYVTVVAVVFVTAFARAVASEMRLRTELAMALRKLDAQREQEEACAVLAERERIAREVHDSVGHALVTAHLHVRLAERDLERDSDAARAALSLARTVLGTGLSELRSTVRTLSGSPASLTDLGRALAGLVAAYDTAELEVLFEVSGTTQELPGHVVLALYRVVQESLTNVVKHASAKHVLLRLDYGPGELSVVVQDDGRGTAKPVSEGFGFTGMRARIASLGGTLEVQAEGGYFVRAQVPMQPVTGDS